MQTWLTFWRSRSPRTGRKRLRFWVITSSTLLLLLLAVLFLFRRNLRFAHYLEVEELIPQDAEAKLRAELARQQGEINRKTGHLTEIIVAGVLNNFDGRTVAGDVYFNMTESIILPRMEKIHRRAGMMKDGELHELDVIGEYKLHNQQEGNAGLGAWFVSVRYQTRPMGGRRGGNVPASRRRAASRKGLRCCHPVVFQQGRLYQSRSTPPQTRRHLQ